MKLVSNVKNAINVAGKNVKHTYVTSKILAKKHAPLALAITAGVGFVATAVTAYKSALALSSPDPTLSRSFVYLSSRSSMRF